MLENYAIHNFVDVYLVLYMTSQLFYLRLKKQWTLRLKKHKSEVSLRLQHPN